MQRDCDQGDADRNGGSCPFVPGFGKVPPHLAGREGHQRAGLACLDSMHKGKPLHESLVMWGPRGNGKTAMLAWIESAARARGIQVVAHSAAEIETPEKLIARVSESAKWTDRIGGFSWKGFQRRARDREADSFDRILARRLRKAPLALLIDEAHTLDLSVGRTILSAVQRFATSDAQLLTVLAGTPGLPDRLGEMQVTFWERSQILPCDRLDERSASNAIRIPFESAGRTITGDALAQVVSASHGYPFFLQLWGKLLWESEGAAAKHVRSSDVDRVRTEFEALRNQLYGLRFRELRRLNLLLEAAAIAEAYGEAQELPGSEIERALEAKLIKQSGSQDEHSVSATIGRLEALGYIWDPGGERTGSYVRGIPSLMDFVLQRVQGS